MLHCALKTILQRGNITTLKEALQGREIVQWQRTFAKDPICIPSTHGLQPSVTQAPIWQLTIPCNSSPRCSNEYSLLLAIGTRYACGANTNMQTNIHMGKIEISKNASKCAQRKLHSTLGPLRMPG